MFKRGGLIPEESDRVGPFLLSPGYAILPEEVPEHWREILDRINALGGLSEKGS